VVGDPARSRGLELDERCGPLQPRPFYDSYNFMNIHWDNSNIGQNLSNQTHPNLHEIKAVLFRVFNSDLSKRVYFIN